MLVVLRFQATETRNIKYARIFAQVRSLFYYAIFPCERYRKIFRLSEKLVENARTLTHYQVICPHPDDGCPSTSCSFMSYRDFLKHRTMLD